MKKIINISSGATYVDHIGSQTINNYNGTVNNYNGTANNYNGMETLHDAPPADSGNGGAALPTCLQLPEEEESLPDGLTPADVRVVSVLEYMRKERILCFAYDYAWVMMLFMDDKTHMLPRHFNSPKPFLDYLSDNLGLTGCPDASSLNRKIKLTHGEFPNWRFDDADGRETIRRNNVAKAFLGAFRRF